LFPTGIRVSKTGRDVTPHGAVLARVPARGGSRMPRTRGQGSRVSRNGNGDGSRRLGHVVSQSRSFGYDLCMEASDMAEMPWYRRPRAAQLVAVGIILLASGVAHGSAQLLLGGPWEGAITWRKPILFGISGGLTSFSLGWVWTALPQRRGDRWLAAATAWALLVEVFLIDLQRWRGVASHFNRDTPLDSWLYDVMGGLILFVSLVIADLTVRLFRCNSAMPSDMLLAAQAGMVFLVISCGLGIWISVYGDLRVAQGLDPERYGAAGVPKFPHGAVIHAIQWLPVIAWAGRRAGVLIRSRTWLVGMAAAGTAAILAYALLQTAAGRSRFDAPVESLGVLVLGIACIAAPVAIIARVAIATRLAR